MELLFRSIARAGGIEVPIHIRIIEAPQRKVRQKRDPMALAAIRSVLASALNRLGERVAALRAEAHKNALIAP